MPQHEAEVLAPEQGGSEKEKKVTNHAHAQSPQAYAWWPHLGYG